MLSPYERLTGTGSDVAAHGEIPQGFGTQPDMTDSDLSFEDTFEDTQVCSFPCQLELQRCRELCEAHTGKSTDVIPRLAVRCLRVCELFEGSLTAHAICHLPPL